MLTRIKPVLGILAAILLLPALAGAEGMIYTKDGVALGGTDPVAYFEVGEPVQGSADHSHAWRGTLWHFANAEHRDRFAAEPEAYAPQYGGWCAWAAARGYAAKTVPDAWKIVDGKLYLNFNQTIQRRWERNIERYISAADEHWPDIF
ncbi:MAG: hypothetical protein JJT90_14320 [Ectothiorhodospiraceae bacterium]|nr:hypothetical protein [Ectothiorhodospiraceae bacterium]